MSFSSENMLKPDDLEPGLFCTVHRGRPQVCPCGCGGSGPEPYERLKGMPLMVKAINLPYVAAVLVPASALVIVDVREAELCTINEDYLAAFRPGQAGIPAPTPDPGNGGVP